MTGKTLGVAGACWMLLLAIASVGGPVALVGSSSTAARPTATLPGEQGPCTVSSQAVEVDGELATLVLFPSEGTCGAHITAPYPAVAFAHGFSMFGFSDGVEENRCNGEHLASWGYVVAIPELPDDFGVRLTALQHVVSYLETSSAAVGSFLYQQVDPKRLAAAGHSLGGATALALASQDARIRAVVALDPVYHTGEPGGGDALWNPETEGPKIEVPAALLGAPASSCNADADYTRIYPWIGATHKASYTLVGGSHCDFTDPGAAFCSMICGQAAPARTELSQSYMTAWLNYYLYLDTESFSFLYGAAGDADVASGRIERQIDTAPRGLTAKADRAIHLAWTPYAHPIIAGYTIYRRLPSETKAGVPYARVGRVGSFTDTSIVLDQVYFYTVRSHDAASNVHQPADEVSARVSRPEEMAHHLYLPLTLSERVRRTGSYGTD